MFTRSELQFIRNRALDDQLAADHPGWKARYRALADAADLLDAFMARSEVLIDNSSLADADSIPEIFRPPPED